MNRQPIAMPPQKPMREMGQSVRIPMDEEGFICGRTPHARPPYYDVRINRTGEVITVKEEFVYDQ